MTLADLVTQIISAVTGIVPATTIALFVAAGAVISLAGVLLRRFLKAGR